MQDGGVGGFKIEAGTCGFEAEEGTRGFEAEAGTCGFEAEAGTRGFEVEAGTRGFEVEAGTCGFEAEGGTAGGPFFLVEEVASTLRLVGIMGLYSGGDTFEANCCAGSIFFWGGGFAAADVRTCFECLPLIVSATQRCQTVAAAAVLHVNK